MTTMDNWLCLTNDDRRIALATFWDEWMRHPVRIGFNSLHYDGPVVVRQSQLLGIDWPRDISFNRYRADSIDLMQFLSFQGEIDPLSLTAYCRLFGRPGESDDDGAGSQVAEWFAQADYERIKQHNAEDIRRTAWLAKRLGVVVADGAQPMIFDVETIGRASCADLVKPARNLKDPAKVADIVCLSWQIGLEDPS